MNRRYTGAAVLAMVCAALVAGAAHLAAQQPAALATGETRVLDVQGGKIRVTALATGLFHPWSLAFTPDGALLVAERDGKLRVIRNGVMAPAPVWTSPTPPGQGRDALHGLAVHPKFAQNKFVYVSYPKNGPKGNTLAVGRGRLEGDTLTEFTEIFVADAWETSGNLAGHMRFGPDDTLYVMVGDRDRLCCTGSEDNSLRMKAQSLANDVGKTLRLTDIGGIPNDNPFVGKAGAKPEIFTYGHRNGYGLAFNPETGELWQAEIGPMGGDEVNILIAGHNYGWPLVSMGRNYTGSLVSDQPWARPGMDNPRMFWVPSVSPSGIMFYTGDKFPRWKNSLFVAALTTRQLIRVSFKQPSQAEKREPVLAPLNLRIRDVTQGPDGDIYVTTEQQTRGTVADGAVLRIEPAE
ncbi:MAG TPA: PQQ-dependent sugar dehydrogenase [Vicinamibacterales bacterium]|nr:PQQ-dependent sugar dehydrogenase [Vicinamibacterales bacterium]